MIALTLAATLLWTAPARDTLGQPMSGTLECIAVHQRQSPTAVRLGAMLYANPDTFRVYWPTVKAEADTDIAARVMAAPGAACSVALPDTGYWLWVVTRQAHSAWSARSAWVWK